jgi:hypothetical protein
MGALRARQDGSLYLPVYRVYRVISNCHIILGPIVTFGDRLSPRVPRQSPYNLRQSCDCQDCHKVTIVGSTCSTSTDYIGKLHTT